MSVQNGLKEAIELVDRLIKAKQFKYFEWQSEYRARNVKDALERALARYEKEAKRISKYRPQH